MVPLPSLSSPESLGFPVYDKGLMAIIRSEMGFMSDSLPLLMPLFSLLLLFKALCAAKSREGQVEFSVAFILAGSFSAALLLDG